MPRMDEPEEYEITARKIKGIYDKLGFRYGLNIYDAEKTMCTESEHDHLFRQHPAWEYCPYCSFKRVTYVRTD